MGRKGPFSLSRSLGKYLRIVLFETLLLTHGLGWGIVLLKDFCSVREAPWFFSFTLLN